MSKNLNMLYAVVLSTGICAAEASNRYGPKVSMEFDEDLVSKDLTAGNAEAHLDNLGVALMENREDLLKIMDSAENAMDEGEILTAKAYAETMSKYEKAALMAALQQRDNKHGLKQVLDILEGKL